MMKSQRAHLNRVSEQLCAKMRERSVRYEMIAHPKLSRQGGSQLKVKLADLSVGNDILTEAIEIQKKRNLLKQLGLLEKSSKPKNSK